MRRRTTAPLGVAAVLALALAACAPAADDPPTTAPENGTEDGDPGDEPDDGELGGTVTLVTHDSFHWDEDLRAAFEAETGITVELVAPGDGGALVNQLILTKENPLGDVVFGVDNSFASRAIAEGVFEPYDSGVPAAADAAEFAIDDSGTLTAIDYGDVCLNIDTGWFAEAGIPEPETLDDLRDPQYAALTVTPSATTSSPGLAFLLATVGAYGPDGWQDYWSDLAAGGLSVVQGWSDAYFVDFTAGGGDGDRPIVLSYASSPPYTVPEEGAEPTTRALLDTCFRQVEYAGVLAGASNPVGARAVIDHLLSDDFQATIPESMFVYPVSSAVDLPEDWVAWAPLAGEPFDVDPGLIAEHRDDWVREWSDIVTG